MNCQPRVPLNHPLVGLGGLHPILNLKQLSNHYVDMYIYDAYYETGMATY